MKRLVLIFVCVVVLGAASVALADNSTGFSIPKPKPGQEFGQVIIGKETP